MLAIPLLLGVAVSRPSPWQLVLAVASVAGYLASSATLEWLRSRRTSRYLAPIGLYGIVLGMTGVGLLAAHPWLAATLLVIVPAAGIALRESFSGRPRSLVASLAQVAQALVLVPASAGISGSADGPSILRATLVAGIFLVGTVLVVRSLIRERDNPAFIAVSIGFHLVAVVVEALLLPAAYAVLALVLAFRAAALPVLQRRLADGPRRLRPIHVGIAEMVASMLLVAISLLVRV